MDFICQFPLKKILIAKIPGNFPIERVNMNDFNFHEKIVLITGGSRGIGRQIAIDFARRGAKVAISYRSDKAAAEATLAMLEGQGHLMIQAEMSDPQSVLAMVNQVFDKLGGL